MMKYLPIRKFLKQELKVLGELETKINMYQSLTYIDILTD